MTGEQDPTTYCDEKLTRAHRRQGDSGARASRASCSSRAHTRESPPTPVSPVGVQRPPAPGCRGGRAQARVGSQGHMR